MSCQRCGAVWGQRWRTTARLFHIDVPIWKHGAFDYLESIGQRFCVDFGLENAMEKARADWATRKHKERVH